jgi:hypothetical protein
MTLLTRTPEMKLRTLILRKDLTHINLEATISFRSATDRREDIRSSVNLDTEDALRCGSPATMTLRTLRSLPLLDGNPYGPTHVAVKVVTEYES